MGLERVALVRDALGLEPSFPIITVGGTNGKGSTCAMLEAILSSAGYRVGCYTSPHLMRYNERVRVNGAEVEDNMLCEAFLAVEEARGDISLTYFEFGTLAAMWYFQQQKLDIAILEVGLGGRLDAVNAFDPDVSIVTSVDMDHMDFLGDTRDAIGLEKAGIFRRGNRAVCGDLNPPASLLSHAAEIGADLWRIGKDFGVETYNNHQWRYWEKNGVSRSLSYPTLRGDFQLRNAACAIAALNSLGSILPVSVNDIRKGLMETKIEGRFQVLPGLPLTILDVAHNPEAARSLALNLSSFSPQGKTIGVWGMLKDKDMVAVADALKESIDLWIPVSLNTARGATTKELQQILERQGLNHESGCNDVASGYRYACQLAGVSDKIIVFGSFFTVAEAIQHVDRA